MLPIPHKLYSHRHSNKSSGHPNELHYTSVGCHSRSVESATALLMRKKGLTKSFTILTKSVTTQRCPAVADCQFMLPSFFGAASLPS
uniref:Uncharacterized protein n=1 Tax=Parascaris univalens TaxID=6257 RepID=A0A915A220_PARUN